jgi:hypothetical protein
MPDNATRAQRRAGADFAIEVDFAPGSPDPSRVFRSMMQLIDTFQKFDRELVHTIDVNIQPIMLLEDVETGSIKGWLSAWLEATDDTGLKELSWKKIVGGYLVKAKYLLIDYLNSATEIIGREDIERLQARIRTAAEETGVKRIPAYTPPSKALLIRSITDISYSLAPLQRGDRAIFETRSGETVEFNLSIRIVPETLNELLIEQSLSHDEEVILKVKKPDFLGDSRWEFVHDTVLEAKMVDLEWLTRFRNNEVNLQPGSAIKAMVHVEVGYGYDREIVSRKYQVVKVLDVIPPPRHEQPRLLP